MAGRKKTHVQSGNRNRSRSPPRCKQPIKNQAKSAKQIQPKQDDETTSPSPMDKPQDTAHQQKLLGTFQGTLAAVLTSGNFNAILQEVKSALYKRDFARAFGSEPFLEAYAARWSPTRALCYAAVLDAISTHLDALQRPDPAAADAARTLHVLAIGGAAAELVAFASYLSRRRRDPLEADAEAGGAITLVDVAPWGGVVDKLRAGLAAPPPLSKYASAARRAANTPVDEAARLRDVVFQQRDVLALAGAELAALVRAASAGRGAPVLATLLFTLNELFTGGGIGKTTTFLLTLTSSLPTGSLLLVIDSPGSYSETTVGKQAKRYPMAWLLDKILQGAAGDDDDDEAGKRWERVESKDSVWFRLGNELTYPIPLEDMRYQMHLYRKGAPGGAELGEEQWLGEP